MASLDVYRLYNFNPASAVQPMLDVLLVSFLCFPVRHFLGRRSFAVCQDCANECLSCLLYGTVSGWRLTAGAAHTALTSTKLSTCVRAPLALRSLSTDFYSLISCLTLPPMTGSQPGRLLMVHLVLLRGERTSSLPRSCRAGWSGGRSATRRVRVEQCRTGTPVASSTRRQRERARALGLSR